MKTEKEIYWQRFLETGQITDYLQYRRRKEDSHLDKQKDRQKNNGTITES